MHKDQFSLLQKSINAPKKEHGEVIEIVRKEVERMYGARMNELEEQLKSVQDELKEQRAMLQQQQEEFQRWKADSKKKLIAMINDEFP